MNTLSSRLFAALKSPTITSTRKGSSFHPSSASIEVPSPIGGTEIIGACLRKQYYQMTEAPITNERVPDWVISANLGDKISDLIADYLNEYGFHMGIQRLTEEHPFYDNRYNVSGRSDLIVWDHNIGEPIGIEVKSVGEYKAGKCIEKPADEHVMQCMLYLDYYNHAIPDDQVQINRWYIWYVSRAENWTIKGKKHGSPLTMMWDYSITLDNNGIPTVHTANGSERWSTFSLSGIHARYSDLKDCLQKGVLPPRDFQVQYSDAKITALYKKDLLTRKLDKDKIEKWLKKGAPAGRLKVLLGDFSCKLCSYAEHCWNNVNDPISKDSFHLPSTPSVERENKVLTQDSSEDSLLL